MQSVALCKKHVTMSRRKETRKKIESEKAKKNNAWMNEPMQAKRERTKEWVSLDRVNKWVMRTKER